MMKCFKPDDLSADLKDLYPIWKKNNSALSFSRPRTEIRIRLTHEELSDLWANLRFHPLVLRDLGYQAAPLLDEFIRVNEIELLDDDVFIPAQPEWNSKKKKLLYFFVPMWEMRTQLANAVGIPRGYLFPKESSTVVSHE